MNPARLARTRSTKLVYTSVGTFGWFLYAFGPAINLLGDEQHVTKLVMSLHMSMYALGTMCGVFLTTWSVRRFGRGISLRAFALALASSLLGFTLVSAPPATIAFALLIGCFATANVTLASSFLDQEHGDRANVALSEANLAAAVTGFLSPLSVGLFVSLGLSWRAALWLAVIGLLAIEALRGDLTRFDAPQSGDEQAHRKLPADYWWAWALLIATAGSEFIFVLWSGPLLQAQAGLGDAAAAASLATFTGGIAVGRAVTARLAHRYSPEQLLRVAFAIPLAAFWGLWLGGSAVVMLVSLFVCGVGVGAHWPLGISRLVKAGSVDPDSAATKSALATGGASMAFPVLLGALADQIGIHAAFGFLPVLLLAGLALVSFRPLE